MESKSLLFGIIGFIMGGLIVSVAASSVQPPSHDHDDTSMTSMTESLKSKKGDEFDKEFITQMIAHHQGALDMARLADKQAQHNEVKQLAADIITSQSQQITQLTTWQKQWGYSSESTDSMHMSH